VVVPVRTKRWNDAAEPEDGYRLLVCRYRPRGVTREAEPWDAWCNALSPSVELHAAAYGKDGAERIAWEEYERRFLEEMKRQRYWIESFAARVKAGQTLTILCSSACTDSARCHRTLVKRLLEEAAFPPSPAPRAPTVVRRRT
jgi:uncharacterized protein YeaO (DUF488 family)